MASAEHCRAMLLDPPLRVGPDSDPGRYLLLVEQELDETRRRYRAHDLQDGLSVEVLTDSSPEAVRCPEPQRPDGWVRLVDQFVVPSGGPGAEPTRHVVQELVDGPNLASWSAEHPLKTSQECHDIVSRLTSLVEERPHGSITEADVVLSHRGFLLAPPAMAAGQEQPEDELLRSRDRESLQHITVLLLVGVDSSEDAERARSPRRPSPPHRARRALAFAVVAAVIAIFGGTATADTGPTRKGSPIGLPLPPIGEIGDSGAVDIVNVPSGAEPVSSGN
ncbi:MAG: hypothetical protein ACI8Y4_000949 [Candidatus Poriferisodalaceae bacterium]|jgi:hypothetical protein